MVDPVYAGIDRDQLLIRLNRENIGAGVHYLSVPEHPYYQDRFGWKLEDTPQAVALGRQTISLPLSAKLTDQDVEDVITAVKLCLKP